MGNRGLTENVTQKRVERKNKGELKMVQAEKQDEQENVTTIELARPNIHTQERNSWLTSKRLLKEGDR